MKINIDKTKIKYSEEQIEALRTKGEDALDSLWDTPWVKASLAKPDSEETETIKKLAEAIQNQCGLLIVVATGDIASVIKSAIRALPIEGDFPEVVVFGDTLSSLEYSNLILKIRNTETNLIGISTGEESLQLKTAFACIKKMMVSKYGVEKVSEKILLVAGEKSLSLKTMAAEEKLSCLTCQSDIEEIHGITTIGALLPIAIAGIDIDEVLRGCYDSISSPIWDKDGKDYALIKYLLIKDGATSEAISVGQEELQGVATYAEKLFTNETVLATKATLPRDQQRIVRPNTFETVINIEKEETDIMLPIFDGVGEDGSLAIMLKENLQSIIEEHFAKDIPVVTISVETLNSYTFGQLITFLSVSDGITKYLMQNLK
ncbi:MAG: hypothetical protein RR313_12215 [Anaerovoracaceae bacterium]